MRNLVQQIDRYFTVAVSTPQLERKAKDLLRRARAEIERLWAIEEAAKKDKELLDWLHENHFFVRDEGKMTNWEFRAPRTDRVWEPIRDKLQRAKDDRR